MPAFLLVPVGIWIGKFVIAKSIIGLAGLAGAKGTGVYIGAKWGASAISWIM